jgi:hypothetical protein
MAEVCCRTKADKTRKVFGGNYKQIEEEFVVPSLFLRHILYFAEKLTGILDTRQMSKRNRRFFTAGAMKITHHEY